jgi:hypothetical protein
VAFDRQPKGHTLVLVLRHKVNQDDQSKFNRQAGSLSPRLGQRAAAGQVSKPASLSASDRLEACRHGLFRNAYNRNNRFTCRQFLRFLPCCTASSHDKLATIGEDQFKD